MNQRVPHNTLAAALATPEEGVTKPSRAQPTSAVTQIAALAVGESWCRVLRPDGTHSLSVYATNSAQWRDDLRNAVQASVRHAQNKTRGTYSIESGDFISSNRTLYLVCVVTRVA
jgi:hypothetical protein